jgi:hypothetical protein
MRFTRYIAACCKELTEQEEYPTDKMIGPLVKLHDLNARVARTFGYFDQEGDIVKGDAAVQFAVISFMRELDLLRSRSPDLLGETIRIHVSISQIADSHDQGTGSLLVEALSLESWIFEVAFHDHAWDSSHTVSSALPTPQRATGFRTQILWRLTETNKSIFQAFLAIPDTELPRLTFSTYSKLCYVLISQARAALVLLELIFTQPISAVGAAVRGYRDNSWQLPSAQEVIERVGYRYSCQALVEKFAHTAAMLQREGADGGDAMMQMSRLTKSMMKSYAKKLQARGTSWDGDSRTASGASQGRPARGLSPDGIALGSLGATLGREQEANIDNLIANDILEFDDQIWESILQNFSLPVEFGNPRPLSRPL